MNRTKCSELAFFITTKKNVDIKSKLENLGKSLLIQANRNTEGQDSYLTKKITTLSSTISIGMIGINDNSSLHELSIIEHQNGIIINQLKNSENREVPPIEKRDEIVEIDDLTENYFSLSIDTTNREIKASIDHLGKERVYTFNTRDGDLVISTRLLPVLRLPNEHFTPNEQFLSQIVIFGYTIDNSTAYKEIERLKPGVTSYSFNDHNIQLINNGSYFEFDECHYNKYSEESFGQSISQIIELNIRNSIAQKKSSIGLMCSGGMDSRLVLSLLDKLNQRVSCFTLGQDDYAGKSVVEKMARTTKNDSYFVNSYELFKKDPLFYIKNSILDNECFFFFRQAVNLPYFQEVQSHGINRILGGYGGELMRLKRNFGDHQAIINGDDRAYSLQFFQRLSKVSQISDPINGLTSEFLSSANKTCFEIFQKKMVSHEDPKLRAYMNFFENCMRQILINLTARRPSGVELSVPFLSKEFINTSMHIPLSEKKNDSIHKAIIKQNSPRLLNIPDSNTLIPPSLPKPFHSAGRLGIRLAKKLRLIKHYHVGDTQFVKDLRVIERDILESKSNFFGNFMEAKEYDKLKALNPSIHLRLLDLEMFNYYFNEMRYR